MTKEFYVDTHKLKAVAQQISTLLESIQSDDATPGTPKNFARARSIAEPTATFWEGDNTLADCYGHEWTYVNDTYAKLVQQLQAVLSACNSTVTKYSTHESDAKKDIKGSAPTNYDPRLT